MARKPRTQYPGAMNRVMNRGARRDKNMKHFFHAFTLACLALFGLTRPLEAAGPVVVASPDGAIKAELTSADGVLRYRVTVDGNQVLAPSTLGMLTDGIELGRGAVLGAPTFRSIDERYRFFGGHSTAVNQAREAAVPVTAGGESYFVDLHVANDGVGVRLRLSAKPGRKLQADRSTWRLEGDPVLWAARLQAAYESTYQTTSLGNLGTNSYGFPMTAKIGGLYVTLTEAALKDYGDLAVRRSADGALQGYLYADSDGWTTDDAVVQPWRVTIVARDLTALVNSTLVQNLNPPVDPSMANADWIRPGRSTWQWMAVGAPRLDDQQQWVDWTKALGYERFGEPFSLASDKACRMFRTCVHGNDPNRKHPMWAGAAQQIPNLGARRLHLETKPASSRGRRRIGNGVRDVRRRREVGVRADPTPDA